MKKGWEIKKLGEVFDVRDGTHDSPQYITEGFPLITSKNLKNGIITYDKVKFISESDYKKINKRSKVDIGDVLFAMIGTIGNPVEIVDEPNYAIKNVALFKVNKNQNSGFLKYYLNTPFVIEKMNKEAKGTTQKFVGLGYLRNFPIPIPPLPEQKRIVSILDRVFSAIEQSRNNAEQNLKNAKELFQSKLQAIFDNGKLKIENGEWVEKKLKDVCEKITDGTHQTPKYFDNGFVFLSSKNVTSGKIDWNNVRYIDEKQHIEMHKRVSPKIGDILLAKNGTTGVAAMVDRDVIFDIYVSLAHIRVKDEVIPEFMLYFINSPIAKKQFNKRLKGIGVPNLHLQEIREVVINFPKSKSEQKQIVQELDVLQAETKKLEEIYQKKIEDLDELKKSILQKAFSGQLKIENGEWRIEKDN
jgi:type I restriction enzyme S subunit